MADMESLIPPPGGERNYDDSLVDEFFREILQRVEVEQVDLRDVYTNGHKIGIIVEVLIDGVRKHNFSH